MAGSINGIIIELRGNPSELRKELEKIETIAGNLNKKLENGGTHWSKLGSAAENFGSKIDKVGTMLSNLGTKLSNNVTNPMLKNLGDMIKTAGDLSQVFGTVTTGVGTLTRAIDLMKFGIGNATGAAADLAKGLQLVFSPTGLVVGAVTAGIGIIFSKMKEAQQEKKIKEEEAKRAAQEALDAIEAERQAVEEFRNSINSNLQVELEHINRTEALWQELQKITDENGKIKDGYEDRAKVITGELSKALDTEIKLTDNAIENYQELQKEIDILILKKKGEAILNASEKKSQDAMENKNQKQQELIDKEKNLETAKKEEKDAYDEYQKIDNIIKNRYMSGGERAVYEIEKKKAKDKWKEKERNSKQQQKEYNAINAQLETYTRDIEDFYYNVELYTRGTTEDIQKMIDNTGKTYISNGKMIDLDFQRRIKAQQDEFNNAKQRNTDAVKNHNQVEEEKSQITINESKRRLELMVKELDDATMIVGENSNEVIEGWKQLATGSFEVYNEEVSKLPIMTQQKIEELAGVAITKAPEIESVMEHLGTVGLNALEQDENFRNKALESLESYINGLTDEEKREVLHAVGIQNVEEVIKGFSNGNLAEEKGIEILKCLDKGLRDGVIREELLKSATTLANKLSKALIIKPIVSAGIAGIETVKKQLPGHKLGLDYVPYDNYIARLHKGERILTAKENEQLIKFEKMPKVADNTSLINNRMRIMDNKIICTTPNITFNVQKMDKANLDMAFNYINKRFGTQY